MHSLVHLLFAQQEGHSLVVGKSRHSLGYWEALQISGYSGKKLASERGENLNGSFKSELSLRSKYEFDYLD